MIIYNLYYNGETFGERCHFFMLKLLGLPALNIHGGKLNTKGCYGVGVIGLQSPKKQLSPQNGSCEGLPIWFGLRFSHMHSDHQYWLANSTIHTCM